MAEPNMHALSCLLLVFMLFASTCNAGFDVVNYSWNGMPNSGFASAVDFQSTLIAVGAPNYTAGVEASGLAVLFPLSGPQITVSSVEPSQAGNFGKSVAFGAASLFIGAPGIGNNTGAVYRTNITGMGGIPTPSLVNLNTTNTRYCGYSIAAEANILVVGCPGYIPPGGTVFGTYPPPPAIEGAVFLSVNSGNSFTAMEPSVHSNNDRSQCSFGAAVAVTMSPEGLGYVAVGSPGTGTCTRPHFSFYGQSQHGGPFIRVKPSENSDSGFATVLALGMYSATGVCLASGAPADNNNKVYLFCFDVTSALQGSPPDPLSLTTTLTSIGGGRMVGLTFLFNTTANYLVVSCTSATYVFIMGSTTSTWTLAQTFSGQGPAVFTSDGLLIPVSPTALALYKFVCTEDGQSFPDCTTPAATLDTGAIIGIVIGSVAAVVAIVAVILCWRKYRKVMKQQKDDKETLPSAVTLQQSNTQPLQRNVPLQQVMVTPQGVIALPSGAQYVMLDPGSTATSMASPAPSAQDSVASVSQVGLVRHPSTVPMRWTRQQMPTSLHPAPNQPQRDSPSDTLVPTPSDSQQQLDPSHGIMVTPATPNPDSAPKPRPAMWSVLESQHSNGSVSEVKSSAGVTNTSSLSESMPKFVVEWEDIQMDKYLGRGAYGDVWSGKLWGTDVAVKVLLKNDGKIKDDFLHEVGLLMSLRHPNVVLFMGACLTKLAIITEFVEQGSLFDILRERPEQVTPAVALSLALGVAKGMNYLHQQKPPIIHRDLKSPNVLVDTHWRPKVADFGLSKVKSSTYVDTMCGSPAWMAPEVVRGSGYTMSCDVFSWGVMLWELFTKRVPYEGVMPMQVLSSKLGAIQLTPLHQDMPLDTPPEVVQLIEETTADDATRRPLFADIIRRLEAMQSQPTSRVASPAVTPSQPIPPVAK